MSAHHRDIRLLSHVYMRQWPSVQIQGQSTVALLFRFSLDLRDTIHLLIIRIIANTIQTYKLSFQIAANCQIGARAIATIHKLPVATSSCRNLFQIYRLYKCTRCRYQGFASIYVGRALGHLPISQKFSCSQTLLEKRVFYSQPLVISMLSFYNGFY